MVSAALDIDAFREFVGFLISEFAIVLADVDVLSSIIHGYLMRSSTSSHPITSSRMIDIRTLQAMAGDAKVVISGK